MLALHGSLIGLPRIVLRNRLLPLLAALLAFAAAAPVAAADLGTGLPATGQAVSDETGERLGALSNLLSLLLVRATFDVEPLEEVPDRLEDRIVAWGINGPSEGEREEIERLLLAEASYYIVSLRYLIEVGGAAFPPDRPESDYANDTLVRLDSLERRLAERLAMHEEVADILGEVEAIRLLTEGSAAMTSGEGVFARHDDLLERARMLAGKGLPT